MGSSRRSSGRRTTARSWRAAGFRNGEREGRSCTFYTGPAALDYCGTGFELWDHRTGYYRVEVASGRPAIIAAELPYAADRAVILRLHTHDALLCTPEVIARLEDCLSRHALDGIAWLGEVKFDPPVPTAAPTLPTDGMTRRDAIARAHDRLATELSARFEFICAELRLYSELEPGVVSNIRRDPWVWNVVMRGGRYGWEQLQLHWRNGNVMGGGGPLPSC